MPSAFLLGLTIRISVIHSFETQQPEKDTYVEKSLLDTITQSQDAVIELHQHDGCKKCGAETKDRKYFCCPKCSFIFCGQCAVPNAFQARTAECPGCHARLPWK